MITVKIATANTFEAVALYVIETTACSIDTTGWSIENTGWSIDLLAGPKIVKAGP